MGWLELTWLKPWCQNIWMETLFPPLFTYTLKTQTGMMFWNIWHVFSTNAFSGLLPLHKYAIRIHIWIYLHIFLGYNQCKGKEYGPQPQKDLPLSAALQPWFFHKDPLVTASCFLCFHANVAPNLGAVVGIPLKCNLWNCNGWLFAGWFLSKPRLESTLYSADSISP